MDSLQFKQSVDMASSVSSAFAEQPVQHVLLVTLPIWLPMISLCVLAVCRSVLFKYLMSFFIGVKAWLGYSAAFTVLLFLPAGTIRRLVSLIPGSSWFLKYLPGAPEDSIQQSGPLKPAAPLAPASELRAWMVPEEELVKFQERILGRAEEGVQWEQVSTKKTNKVHTISWRHILEDNTTEYLTRSVFEKAKAEDMFAFYNSDRTRPKWDKMWNAGEVLEVDERTGAEAVRWVRDFPGWCSQRDYVFGRRSWLEGDTYWTITKATEHPACPERAKPRRVHVYVSSWSIRPVPGREGNLDAVEVMFFHYEDMMIQHDCARLAIRLGLQGVLANLTRGFYDFAALREEQRQAGTAVEMPGYETRVGQERRMSSPQTSTESRPSDGPALSKMFTFRYKGKKARGLAHGAVVQAAKVGLGIVGVLAAGKLVVGGSRKAKGDRWTKRTSKLKP